MQAAVNLPVHCNDTTQVHLIKSRAADRQLGGELLVLGLGERAGLLVPARALQRQPVHKGAIAGGPLHLLIGSILPVCYGHKHIILYIFILYV